MLKVVALISGTGSNLAALLDAIATAEETDPLGEVRILAVGTDTEHANLQVARERRIPTFVVQPRDYPDRAGWGDALLAELTAYKPDVTLLSGFMRLLPPRVVAALAPNLVNTHPAYLPEFPGAHAVRDALAAGVSQTGATIMVVDDGIDTGPIIDQRRIPIRPDDTEATLHERIKPVERELLTETMRRLATGTLNLKEIA